MINNHDYSILRKFDMRRLNFECISYIRVETSMLICGLENDTIQHGRLLLLMHSNMVGSHFYCTTHQACDSPHYSFFTFDTLLVLAMANAQSLSQQGQGTRNIPNRRANCDVSGPGSTSLTVKYRNVGLCSNFPSIEHRLSSTTSNLLLLTDPAE